MRLLCDKRCHLHTHKGAQKDSGEGGENPNNTLPPATPRPITGAFNPSTTHLDKPRGTQGHNHRWEPKIRTSKEWTPCLGPFQGCPSRSSAPVPRCEKLITMSHWEQLSRSHFRLMWVAAWEWDTWWDAGEECFRIAQDSLWDVLGRNPRQEKGEI